MTVGRRLSYSADGWMPGARVATRAWMGLPRCELPGCTIPRRVSRPRDLLAWLFSQEDSSLAVVNWLRCGARPGVS